MSIVDKKVVERETYREETYREVREGDELFSCELNKGISLLGTTHSSISIARSGFVSHGMKLRATRLGITLSYKDSKDEMQFQLVPWTNVSGCRPV